ncbi:ParB N-terminal domain-containing protein [Spirosoma pollinicola]|uniref:Uncharacterized protein n=1 Tax=Spirosoma pollinicola TaxID=2057025 RepID=A0A2K8ZAZ6_9BACT|nr:hypothetical protein [Spirosoma pollinicola]AUD07000.1 hypothetical protein CWM47_37385 [Spirosoma pollinicola]
MLVEIGNYSLEFDDITPQIAKTLLEYNTHNRPLNLPHVKFLSKQMKQGQWQMAGDPIKVSTTGRLLDGQHRLHAIVDSNTTQRAIILYNVPDESFSVMDTGRVRQAADVLSIAGFSDTKTTAATARMLINYERSSIAATMKSQGRKEGSVVTHQDILEYMGSHDLTPYLSKASTWHKTLSIYSKAEYAFFYCILSRVSPDQSVLFLNAVSSGAKLEIDSPMYILRKKLTEYKMNKLSLSPSERFALTIKAWNLYRANKTVKTLAFNADKDEIPIPQ